ncbi:MAG: DUF134 domain-containing protein [Desulfovibrionales bacterium]
MPRPRKCRQVRQNPAVTFFKPQGVPLQRLKGVALPLEGLEAIRLVDDLGHSQEEAAEMMNVSRPTMCRILKEARSLVARALSNGWAIRVEGGDYCLIEDSDQGRCRRGGPCPGRGRGRGRGGGRTNT